MSFTLAGLVLLSFAGRLASVLIAVALVGVGSSVFHPEASRIAHIASGGRFGFAQSFFQVGGNAGSALGPLLAAVIVVARGQSAVLWFSLLALLGIAVLTGIGRWYRRNLAVFQNGKIDALSPPGQAAPDARPGNFISGCLDRAYIFEIFLPRKYVELLHIFLDGKVRPLN